MEELCKVLETLQAENVQLKQKCNAYEIKFSKFSGVETRNVSTNTTVPVKVDFGQNTDPEKN